MPADGVNNDVKSKPVSKLVVSVVPWSNASQFKKVYEYLYSDELVKKKWAYDTISVWETRCHPSLPTAIEASYVLTSAVIQDVLWSNQASFNHHTDIQSIYGSAVTRFVSLTVEVHQDKGRLVKQSASDIAKGLGIPSFIIDVRNEWCHSHRPSLSVLRLAAQDALKYLKDSYWEKEAARVMNHVKKPFDETDLKHWLIRYMYIQCRRLFYGERKSDEEMTMFELNEKLRFIITKKFQNCLKKNKRHFVKVLASDGIFIPFEEELKQMATEEEFVQLQPESDNVVKEADDDDEDSDNNECDSVEENRIIEADIPENHLKMWEPIILLLNKFDAVPLFLETLLRSQGDRTVVSQKLIIAWVLTILRVHRIKIKSRLSRIFSSKGMVPNWRSLFYSAIVNPCKYTTLILPLLLGELNLKKHITLRIVNLLAIYLGQEKDESFEVQKYYKVFTVEELKQIKELQKTERAKQTCNGMTVDSIWSLCPDDRHKFWPIGSIINAIENEEEEQRIEEDFLENFIEPEFSEKFLPSNENVTEEQCEMDVDKSDILPNFEDIRKELKERKSLLYKK